MNKKLGIYELKLFDKPLLRLSLGAPVSLVEVDASCLDLLPAGLILDDEGLWKWLSTRAIPQNRKFSAALCRHLDLAVNDRSGILAACNGLSLNDSYWLTPEGFDGCFDDFNLYENEFSEVLAAIAYTGTISAEAGLTPLSPELTTNGTLRKAWRIHPDGARCLYKGSSVSPKHVGEARAEFLASQVAGAMSLNAVEYDLATWAETSAEACSTCKLFCSKDVSYLRQRKIAFLRSSV